MPVTRSVDEDDSYSLTVHGLDSSTEYWFIVSASRRRLDNNEDIGDVELNGDNNGHVGRWTTPSVFLSDVDNDIDNLRHLDSSMIRVSTLKMELNKSNGWC